jgi:hypothetical protein
MREGPGYGSHMSLNKSFLWWPSEQRPDWSEFPEQLKRNEADGFKILGSAIGSPKFKKETLTKKIDKVAITLDKIASMRNAHHQFILIKWCVNSYKFTHYIRTVNPESYGAELIKIDEMITIALQDVLNDGINPSERTWFSLPANQGGLGIPTTCNIATSTYLGARTHTGLLQAKILGKQEDFDTPRLKELLEILQARHQITEPISFEELNTSTKPQSFLCGKVFDQLALDVRFQLSPRQQILFDASREKGHIHWLDVLPTEFYNQCIPHEQFQLAIKFQFGKRLTTKTACQGCKDIYAMDVFAEHATICKFGGGETSRHNAVRDCVAYQANKANRIAKTEERDLLNDGSARKPADVSIENWVYNRKIAIDIAVVSGTKQEGIKKKEEEKRAKYLLRCNQEGLEFKPFVLDSFGRMGDDARMIIQRLSYNYADGLKISVSKAKCLLKGKSVLAMVMEQSKQIMNRITL